MEAGEQTLSGLTGRPEDFLLEGLSARHRQRFLEGCSLFNARQYWEAHEAWEDVWKEQEGSQKLLLQGLIQAAAAYHLILATPRLTGALRNIEKSLAKLKRMPATCYGVNVEVLRTLLTSTHTEAQRIGPDELRSLKDEFIPVV